MTYIRNPLKNCKIILAITDKTNTSEPVFSIRQEYIRSTSINSDSTASLQDTKEMAFLRFIKNERERKQSAVQYLESGNIEAFGNIIKESSEEKFKIIPKYSEQVRTLFEAACFMSPVCGIYRNKGIFAFIDSKNADSFIKSIEDISEKNAEKKPFFLISDFSATERN